MRNRTRRSATSSPRAPFLRGLLFAALLSASALAQSPQPAARPDRGAVTGAAYAVSDIESVSLNNGNVNLSIPLAALPPIAGGKLSWSISANYNSKLWNVTRREEDHVGDTAWQPYTVDTPQLSDLGGWRIGGAYQIYIRNANEDIDYIENVPESSGHPHHERAMMQWGWYKVVLRTPDGSERELRPEGHSSYPGTIADFLRGYFSVLPSAANPVKYYSFDGTFLTAVVKSANDWTLFMPDGSQVVQTPDGIQRVRDTNGNSIKMFGDANGVHYQDEQTGREIRITYDPAANGGQGQGQVWYQTVGGGWAKVEINYGTTVVQGKIYQATGWATFGGETGGGFTCTYDEVLTTTHVTVVREIVYPPTEPGVAGRRFSFAYTSDETEQVTHNTFRPTCPSGTFQPLTITASKGWGQLKHMVTPLGANVYYEYERDGAASPPMLNPDEIAKETIVEKRVVHEGPTHPLTTDTWTYAVGTNSGHVTNPDGSSASELFYDHDLGSPSFGGGKAGLVYRSISPGVTTDRHWSDKLFQFGSTDSPGGVPNTFNPVVDAEYTTLTDAAGNAIKMSAKTFAHDFNGNVTQVKEYDWFSPSLVARDGLGIPTGVPAGATLLRTTTSSYHNSPPDASSVLIYAKRGGLTTGTPSVLNAARETTTGASVTRMSYDGQAFGTAPTKGNVTQVSRLDDKGDANSANDTWVNMSSTYDATYGNVLTETDALNHVKQFLYEDSTHALPTKVIVDPLNGTGQQVTVTAYDFSTGAVLSTTDPNLQTSEVSYINQLTGVVDPFNRPGVTTAPPVTVGGVAKRRKAFTFYEDSQRRMRVETDLNDEGDRLLKSQETRDQLGRVAVSQQNEGGPTYTITAKTVYVQMGRVVLTSIPTRGDGTLTDGWTRVTHDDARRVVEAATFEGQTQPDATGHGANWKGSVTTQYYANQTTATDQENKSRRTVVDALGRLVRADEPNSANALDDAGGNPVQPTHYSYDTLGNLRRVDQGGQLRFFAYDSLGRLLRAKNPEQGSLTPDGDFPALTDPFTSNAQWSLGYHYDAGGNLTKRKDARNITTAYTYDALNRNRTVDYSNTGAGIDVERFYDGATLGKGRLWATWSGGPPTTATQHTAIDAYDALGRPLTQRQLFRKADNSWQTYSVGRTYNLAGGVLTQTYPSGRSVSYSYDAAGRLAGFAGDLGGSQRTYSTATLYDAAGRMRQEQFGTNTPLYNKRFYNVAGQMSNVRVSTFSITTPGQDGNWNRGAIVNHYSQQTWAGSGSDNNGNLKKQELYIPHDDAVSNYTQMAQHYSYDELNRLKSVTEFHSNQTQSFKQSYSYDRFGNRTIDQANTTANVNNKPFAVDAATNRLAAPAGQTGAMGYDAAGNLTNDTYTQQGGGTRIYDAEGRMTSAQFVSGQTQTALYTYDADGRRVRRKAGAGAEVWQVYGMEGELLAEYGAEAASSSPQKEYGYRAGEMLVTAEPAAGGGGGIETVWVEDAVPAGATTAGDSEGWNWVTSNPSPYSGSAAHQSNVVAGMHQHYFYNATQTLPVGAGDTLYAYVYLDPANPPTQVMLQWNDGSWEHRAYWGANQIGWGTDGTNSRRYMGPLPAAGQWVRLEVAASQVGLEGATLNGMAFTLYGGRATWDRAGKSSAGASASGPVAHWRLDENAGTTAADSSGGGHTGTLNGATWGAGQLGPSSAAFDGVNDYVQVGSQTSLKMTSQMSASAWIYPTGAGSEPTAGGIIVCREGEYELARFPDGTIRWAFANTSPGWNWVSTGHVAPLNQWTHVAVTYDQGVVKTYANGSLVHTHNGAGAIGDVVPAQNDFRVGGRQAVSQHFAGRIDEVRVHNRALSAAEAQALSGTPYTGTAATVPGTIEAEHFDAGGAGVAYHDTTAGTSGQDYDQPPSYPTPTFRQPTDVDIYKSAGYSNNYLILSHAGDWMKYTVNVATAGSYTFRARVIWGGANGTLGTFHVEVDGVDVTGPMQIPDTNWASFSTVTKAGVQLTAGQHVLRVVADTNAGNGITGDFDNFQFTLDSAGGGPAGANVQWLVTDQLGTPRMVVDSTGTLAGVKRHDYLPFGEEVGAGIGGRTTGRGYSQVDNVKQKFTGYERDDETGLDYAQARYYASVQGRFTNPDEFFNDNHASNPQSWNLYAYVRNNPLNAIDPTGMWTDFIDEAGNRTHIEDGRDQVIATSSKVVQKLQGEFSSNIIAYSYDLGLLQESESNLRMTTAEFNAIAGVIYAEASVNATDSEAAAIHGVLRNRANADGNSVLAQATDNTQVFGANEKDRIFDPTASDSKRKAVYLGIAASVVSGKDASNGAYYWHGTDFSKPTRGSHAHEAFYLSGFQFTNKKHDIWNLGDHKSGNKKYDYKYESTAARGKTTFMRLTTAWMKAKGANTWRGTTK